MKTAPDTPFELQPETRILELDGRFHSPVAAADFPEHKLRWRNQRWAQQVGLGNLSDDQWVDHFGKFEPLDGSLTEPLALAYHGDQFGTYNPDIGDGRGFLFGQLRDARGRLLDLGTKGSGQTPWSRSGDGRLTLKGGVREILAAQMLEALGVYTSKPFSLVETGEELHRGDEPSPTRSSVLVRLSHSHVRFGTFQRLAHLQDADGIAELVGYCVRNFYPNALHPGTETSAVALFEEIVGATARLSASWMSAGFVHGVLNTDNMVVTGESFDYGPWRFLPHSDPNFTAAYFDQTGLYRFGRQPLTALWNLGRLGTALTMVAEAEALEKVMEGYQEVYRSAFRDRMFALLGMETGKLEGVEACLKALFEWLTATKASWPQFFFDWCSGAAGEARAMSGPLGSLYKDQPFADVLGGFTQRKVIAEDRLKEHYFQADRPVSLVIEEVEALWSGIASNDDWTQFNAVIDRIEQARTAYAFDPESYAWHSVQSG